MGPLAEAWRAFRVDAACAPLGLKVELSGQISRPVDWQALLPVIRNESDGALTLEGDCFDARIEADRRKGWVRGRLERFPIEAVVRVLLGESLLRRGGLLVHGAALAHHGRAALFTGASGAGKSTLARCGVEGGLTLLSDELVAVLPDATGYAAHGTPWNIGAAKQASLGQIGTLLHAERAELTPVAPSAVLRVLLANVLEPSASLEVRSTLFKIASQVLAVVPSVQLAFAPHPNVSSVLARALAAG